MYSNVALPLTIWTILSLLPKGASIYNVRKTFGILESSGPPLVTNRLTQTIDTLVYS